VSSTTKKSGTVRPSALQVVCRTIDAMQEPVNTARLPPLTTAVRVDLVFVVDGQSVTRSLPPSGRLIIGRGADVPLCVAHRSLSREHAALELPDLVIEDLGSTNGTFVRTMLPDGSTHERRIAVGERAMLSPGSAVRLGAVTAVLVPAFASDSAAPRWTEDSTTLDTRMVELQALVARIAPAEIPVLILGETGAGKEVLAERIHQASPRRARPMLRLNCAALTEQLVESELFGHEKGAFTGAAAAKPGLIETASGGTVLLDEIGDLKLEAQAKLLRVLEEGKVLRVGGVTPRPVDVRFIAATHRDLERGVADGTFRRDLFFRLAGVVLRIPPLRERPSELLALTRAFLREASARHKRPFEPSLSDDALAYLRAHHWPGNIRELRHCVERAVLLCDGATIERRHVDLSASEALHSAPLPAPSKPPEESTAHLVAADSEPLGTRNPLGLTRERIVSALERHAGNQTRAAKALGVSRRTLVNWIERYRIARPRSSTDE
jgi:DNA-binding NtrC family response regulator